MGKIIDGKLIMNFFCGLIFIFEQYVGEDPKQRYRNQRDKDHRDSLREEAARLAQQTDAKGRSR